MLRCQKKTKETTFCQNTSFNHCWEVSPTELFQTLCWQRWSLRITSFQWMAEGKGICKYIIVQYQTHLSLTILMFCQKRSCFQLQWCWKNLPSELCPRWRVQSNNHCLVLAFICSHLRDDNDQCGVDRVFPAWRISYSCDADDVVCSFGFQPRDESSLLWVTLTTEFAFTFYRRMTKHCFGGGCSVGCDDRVDDGGDGQDMFCER